MNDFDELDKMLENIIKEFPEKKKELLENVGDILEEQVKNNIQDRVGTSSDKREKDKLIEGVKTVFGSKNGYVAIRPDWSKSGLHDWIENGHRIVRNGTVVGFVNGKHMYRDSIEQCEGKILELAENMIDEVVKDNG